MFMGGFMRKIVLTLIVLSVFAPSLSFSQQVYVRPSVRRDGTYVKPHYRSNPDSSIYNNWSTRPNINPNTLERGTRDPYKLPSLPKLPNMYDSNDD